jgi:hypothetical protein
MLSSRRCRLFAIQVSRSPSRPICLDDKGTIGQTVGSFAVGLDDRSFLADRSLPDGPLISHTSSVRDLSRAAFGLRLCLRTPYDSDTDKKATTGLQGSARRIEKKPLQPDFRFCCGLVVDY